MMQQKRNYTLVELLVVIGIIGILFGIALPAFNRLTQGNKVTAAARNLNTAISQARSLAIMQRQYVALLLPTSASGLPSSYFFKSYRLCYVTYDGSTYKFSKWTDDGVWRFFPAGAIIADVSASQVWPATSAATPLWDGFTDVTTVDCSDVGAGASLTIKSVVFTPYGKAVTGAYLVVTEGTNDGGTAVYTNKDANGNPANILQMRIMQFTGRCSFL